LLILWPNSSTVSIFSESNCSYEHNTHIFVSLQSTRSIIMRMCCESRQVLLWVVELIRIIGNFATHSLWFRVFRIQP
jgi:hypothetical protein